VSQGTQAIGPKTEEPALRVATPNLAPWSVYDSGCRRTGIGIENIRRLAAEASLRIVLVPMPLESTESQHLLNDIDLFLGDASINGPFRDSVALSIGHHIETVAVSPKVRNGIAPADAPSLRVGSRTRENALRHGFRTAQIKTGEVTTTLTQALINEDIDVLLGGREVVTFALLRHDVAPAIIGEQIAILSTQVIHYRLSARADARWGDRIRQAAQTFDWEGSDRQLRQRFLSARLARTMKSPAQCEREIASEASPSGRQAEQAGDDF
jgi:hypothetical protein